MKVHYAKSVRERIDIEILAAEKAHKQIDFIELSTADAFALLQDINRFTPRTSSTSSILNGGRATYRGVRLRWPEESIP
jgi:hypothetical protein